MATKKDGFRVTIDVVKTDTGYIWRVASDELGFSETGKRVHRFAIAAYAAGREVATEKVRESP